MGHPAAGGRQPRLLRLVRRADRLHERGGWRRARLWPADLHLIGKEIVRFHAVFWPAFLMAGGLPLPKRIFAHGWLLFENDKMSKSRGNIVRSEPIRQVMGADALRYFLLREIVFGQDGSFSYDALVGPLQLGSRQRPGQPGQPHADHDQPVSRRRDSRGQRSRDRRRSPAQTIRTVQETFDRFEFSKGLEAVWALISAVDKFIVQNAPWKLARLTDQDVADRSSSTTLYTAAEALRIATALLSPGAAAIRAEDLGAARHAGFDRSRALRHAGVGRAAAGQKIGEIAGVFPRIEAEGSRSRRCGTGREGDRPSRHVMLGKKPGRRGTR